MCVCLGPRNPPIAEPFPRVSDRNPPMVGALTVRGRFKPRRLTVHQWAQRTRTKIVLAVISSRGSQQFLALRKHFVVSYSQWLWLPTHTRMRWAASRGKGSQLLQPGGDPRSTTMSSLNQKFSMRRVSPARGDSWRRLDLFLEGDFASRMKNFMSWSCWSGEQSPDVSAWLFLCT